MLHPVVFDIETQYNFREVGFDMKKLKVSVVGAYDYKDGQYRAYLEDELPQFFKLIEHASFLIGFNINKFDLPVLSPYYLGNIFQFVTLDILDEVERVLGHRVALDDLARATLNSKKSGHGFLAIDYFKQGKWDKLKSYCLDDVKMTKELYEFGQKNGCLYLQTEKGKREIKVEFNNNIINKTVSLSLPF